MDKFLLKSSGSGGPNSNNPGTVPAGETQENSSSSESDQSDYAEAIDATSKLTKKRRLIVRRYDANYLKYGFVCTIVSGEQRPQCVVCSTVLSNAALIPAKLKRHLQTLHSELVGKPIEYFQRQCDALSKQKSCISQATKINQKALRASYLLAVRIAKSRKPHNVGESLILPAAIEICKEICGEAVAEKLKVIPVSNDTIHRRITNASQDVKEQLVSRISESKKYAIQLDESTDIAGQAQLIAFVRYVSEVGMEEDFLFCQALPTNTTSDEIFKVLNDFMVSNSIEWVWCYGVCTDGAAAMTGRNAGVWARIKAVAPEAKFTHCLLHRESLASKAMSLELKAVFDEIIRIVNFVKSRPLNSRIFSKLCAEMGEEHEHLLLHSEVRWLSRGKVLNRLFELRDPLCIFLSSKNSDLTAHLEDVNWVATLAYLADIFEHLNSLNASMQGPQTNLISLSDKVSGFMAKLEMWQRRISAGTLDNFPQLKAFLELPETVQVHREGLLALVLDHLQSLSQQFKFYFGDLDVSRYSWVCDPFTANADDLNLPVTEIDQLIELSHSTASKAKHRSVSLIEFWNGMKSEYPELYDKALHILLPFATSYLCESGFSALTAIKTKHRAKLNVEDDLRLCLSRLSPRYDKLCDETQAQGSH